MAKELYVDLDVCDVEKLQERVECLKDKVDAFTNTVKREVRMGTADKAMFCRTVDVFAKEYNKLNFQVFRKSTSLDPTTREFIKSYASPDIPEDKRMVAGAKELLRDLARFELKIDEMIDTCDLQLNIPVKEEKPTTSSVKYVIKLSQLFPDFLKHLKEFSKARKD